MAALDFPDSPATGDLYGSSGTVWRWDGARWASTAGASGARGRVAYAEVIATQTLGVGVAEVDVTGLSVTWTADPTRTYRTSIVGAVQSTVVTDNHVTAIKDPVLGQKKLYVGGFNKVTQHYGFTDSLVETGLSGAITRKVSVRGAAGSTGTLTWNSAPNNPGFILVEDITYEAGTSGLNTDGMDARFVNVDGDTMTGQLSGITPTAVAHLTRKDYVDARTPAFSATNPKMLSGSQTATVSSGNITITLPGGGFSTALLGWGGNAGNAQSLAFACNGIPGSTITSIKMYLVQFNNVVVPNGTVSVNWWAAGY